MSASDDAGPVTDSRLERPYTVTGGRTAPTKRLDLITLLHYTGQVRIAHVEPDHGRILLLLRREVMSVAEVAAHLKLPVMVVKVLVSDLLDYKAVQAFSPREPGTDDTAVLEALLAGLKRRL